MSYSWSRFSCGRHGGGGGRDGGEWAVELNANELGSVGLAGVCWEGATFNPRPVYCVCVCMPARHQAASQPDTMLKKINKMKLLHFHPSSSPLFYIFCFPTVVFFQIKNACNEYYSCNIYSITYTFIWILFLFLLQYILSHLLCVCFLSSIWSIWKACWREQYPLLPFLSHLGFGVRGGGTPNNPKAQRLCTHSISQRRKMCSQSYAERHNNLKRGGELSFFCIPTFSYSLCLLDYIKIYNNIFKIGKHKIVII